MNNLIFFYAALTCYLISSIGYLSFLFVRKEKLNRAAFIVLCAGALIHLAGMIMRMGAAGYPPLTNLFGSMSFFSWIIVLTFLATHIKYRLHILGAFVIPVAAIIFVGALAGSKDIEPLLPALRSHWLPIHVSLSFIGYAGFTVAFGVAVSYLIQERQVKSHRIGNMYYRLPSLEILDEILFKLISLGFPFLTLGIITGAIWAHKAWGSYWQWDPKEVWALITWLVYAFYLHARLQHGWRGKKSAYLAIIGFAVVLFTYLGVHLFIPGLHSYL